MPVRSASDKVSATTTRVAALGSNLTLRCNTTDPTSLMWQTLDKLDSSLKTVITSGLQDTDPSHFTRYHLLADQTGHYDLQIVNVESNDSGYIFGCVNLRDLNWAARYHIEVEGIDTPHARSLPSYQFSSLYLSGFFFTSSFNSWLITPEPTNRISWRMDLALRCRRRRALLKTVWARITRFRCIYLLCMMSPATFGRSLTELRESFVKRKSRTVSLHQYWIGV